MKKYFANFCANGSTSFIDPIESNNKRQLIRDIKEIAKGNRFSGNESDWTVYKRCDGSCRIVARGYFDENGNSHILNNSVL